MNRLTTTLNGYLYHSWCVCVCVCVCVCECVCVVLTQVWHQLRNQSVLLLDHYIQSTPQPTPLWPQGQVPDSQGQPSSPEPTDVTQISQSQTCSPCLHFLFHPNYHNCAYSQLTCLPSVWCPSLVVSEWSRAGVLCSPRGAWSYPRVARSLVALLNFHQPHHASPPQRR